jgi:hypothetical protein
MSRSSKELLRDLTVGNSKVFTVPDDLEYEILYGHINFTTVSGGGARQVAVLARDADDAFVFDTEAGADQAAGVTGAHYELLQGIYRETTFVASALNVPIPKDFYLFPGWDLVVYDENDITALDTMAVNIVIRKHPV